MAKKTEAQIRFTAVTSEFRDGIKDMNSALKTMGNELKLNSAQLKGNADDVNLLQDRQALLQRELEASRQKIELTERSLQEAKDILGENSREYENLNNALIRARTQQQNIQNEFDQTSRRIEELSNSADDAESDIDNLGDALEDLGDSADAADGGFTTLKGAMAEFTGNMLTKATEKLGEFISQLWELPEATEEYRTMMAKLEGSTEQNNYKIDEAKEKYTELYGYLKDDMAVTNCITNTQKMGLEQEQVNEVLDASVAVWTAYGDSIPIEGLTESITETAQVGQITGNLADALNWAGISEDKFNEQLAKCNSESERAKLITDALNGAYGESKRIYDENTEGMRENNEAQQELVDIQARLAEAILPVQTAITNVKVALLEALAPAIEWVCNGIGELVEWFNGLSPATQNIIKTIGIIAGVVSGVTVAIGALLAIIGALSTAWGLITTGAGLVAGAIAAISTPVLIVIGVITSLIAIGTALYKNWDTVKANAVSIWNSITSTISNAVNKAKNVVNSGFKLINTYIVNPIKNAYNTVVSTFSNIYNTINTKINNAKDAVRSAIEKMKSFFNFKWSLPSIKLPHFSVSGSANPIDWLTQGVPKISVQWYAQGGIMDGATVFGMNGNSLMVGGESGREAILPLDGFYNYLDNKLDTIVASERIDYDRMTDSFISALKTMSITMSAKEVGRLTSKYTEEDINIRSRKAKRFGGDLDV